MSSRSRMLKRGLYCLMKFCSVSSASASVTTTSAWMSSISSRQRGRAVHRRVREVTRHPLADRLRLAHVDDAPAAVAEDVDAGLIGQGATLLAEALGLGFDGHRSAATDRTRRSGPQLGGLLSVRDHMHRTRTTLVVAALAALVLCAPASANYRVGLSEQDARVFSQPAWQALKLKRVRYILSWDYYKDSGPGSAGRRLPQHRARRQAGRAGDVHRAPRLLRRTASTRSPAPARRLRRPRTRRRSRRSARRIRG